MANRSLLMKTEQLQLTIRIFTWLLWGIVLTGNTLMLALVTFFPLEILITLLYFLVLIPCQLMLVVRHARQTGQWRTIILLWGIYSLARIMAVAMHNRSLEIGETIAMFIVVDTMLAAWLAMLILVIRRDVSVVFLIIISTLAPIILRAQIMAAGGILAWLQGPTPSAKFETFTIAEPLTMTFSCMMALAIPTLVVHLLWLLIKELRQDQF